MIVDKLSNATLYQRLTPRISIALEYLQSTDFSKLEPGKYEVDGKEVYALVSAYNTKKLEDARWEAHRKYLDIQYVIEGAEQMGFTPIDKLTQVDDYNNEKDILFFTGSGDYATIEAGMFAIFFPQDGHQPCVEISESKPVKKVVIKVLMDH